MITWSAGVSYPQIFSNYNISSITWLNRFGYSTTYWDQFGVTFTNPLPNTNYILIANGYQPYYNPPQIFVNFHPIYSNRTTTSFTMSLATVNSEDAYTSVSSSYPNDKYGYITFEILG